MINNILIQFQQLQFKGFTLVTVNQFSPKKWLAEDEPSKIIMAVLGDYRKENAEIILEAIVSKLRRVCKTDSELKKFIEQLIIISRMRNLEKLTIKISKAMPITIDIEKDYLYNLGLKKNEAEVKAARIEVEKAEAKARTEAEKARTEAEKARTEAEKAKTEAEKAKAEKVKAKLDKQNSIKKMKSTGRFSDEEIMEFLNLDKKTFDAFWKEINKKE